MLKLVEIAPIADVYAQSVGDVELLGENVRLIYYVQSAGENVIVAKIVLPIASVRGHVPGLIAAKRLQEIGLRLMQ